MKLLNSTKAAENPAPSFMPFIILFAIALGAILVFLSLFISSFVANDVQIPKDVESFIVMQRFYSSPNCFAYEDANTGRVYQKVIDLEKFKNQATMNKCFPSNSKYSFKFELEDPENPGMITAATPNWIAGYNFRQEQKNIFVYSNNRMESRKLSIFIQNA